MDKLGVSARKGVKVVMRQSFYKGHYALLDFRTLDPRPVCVSFYDFLTLTIIQNISYWSLPK